MFDVFAKYATDEVAETQGTLVTMNGVQWLVARSGNTKYSNLMSELYTKNEQALEAKDEASEKVFDDMLIEVYSKTLLLGWDGTVGFKGELLPYSLDNAKTLLAIKDFRKAILALANNVENFRYKQEEAQVKN